MNMEILTFGVCEIEFPAAIEMSNTTYKGLLKSIYKWESVVYGNGDVCGVGNTGCGLCEEHGSDCVGCPVAAVALSGCCGTPYCTYLDKYRYWKYEGVSNDEYYAVHEAAEQELAFLKEIRCRSVIV